MRFASGRHPDDAHLAAALIGELSMRSTDFAPIWAFHDVHECTFGARIFHHPAIGDVRLDYQAWTQPDAPDLRLQIYTERPGGADEVRITLFTNYRSRERGCRVMCPKFGTAPTPATEANSHERSGDGMQHRGRLGLPPP